MMHFSVFSLFMETRRVDLYIIFHSVIMIFERWSVIIMLHWISHLAFIFYFHSFYFCVVDLI